MDRKSSVASPVRSQAAAAKARRRNVLIGVILLVVVVAALLYTEQVALLYVLATLGVSALLIAVAFAPIGEARVATQPAPFDDAAAIADRNTGATHTTVGSRAPVGARTQVFRDRKS